MKGTLWGFSALVVAIAVAIVACGGDKPPMTPDSVDGPGLDVSEAGAPATPAAPSAAAPQPTKK